MRAFALPCPKLIGVLAAGVISVSSAIAIAEDIEKETDPVVEPINIVLPLVDAEDGRRLFVTKGCVLCHAVNEAGGIAAPALDAEGGGEQLDLVHFIVRMWNGAQAMIELQALELGYQIELNGDEIGHLAGFAASPEAQRGLSLRGVPDTMRA